jgi:hypothetical protein
MSLGILWAEWQDEFGDIMGDMEILTFLKVYVYK